MKKTIITFMALLCCIATWAQWTKPAAPATQPLAEDVEMYLYNVDADAFWLGANDWGTRASVSKEHGWKVSLAKYTLNEGDAWDGQSYKIMSLVEKPDGWQNGLTMAAKIADWNSIWVDAEDGNTDAKGWTFRQQADGTYLIGFSPLDEKFYEIFPDNVLGVIADGSDDRLYLTDATELYLTRWYFVSAANYEAYMAAKAQYDAALPLGEAIETAKILFPSLDIASIDAVYNNHASTTEQLNEARRTLTTMMMAAATPEKPVDATWMYITNPSYDQNNGAGWSGTAPGFQKRGNAEFYDCNYDVKQTLSVPAGVYVVAVQAFYRAGWADNDAEAQAALDDELPAPQNAVLYAGNALLNNSTPLPFASTGATAEALCSETLENAYGFIPNSMTSAAEYMEAGQYPGTSVIAVVGNDGALTIGLKKSVHIVGDWTIFDNWKLVYLGNNAEAYAYLRNDYLSHETNYLKLVADEEIIYYGRDAFNAYKSAREALDAATTPEAITAALNTLIEATEALKVNLAAYATLEKKLRDAEAFCRENDGLLSDEYMEGIYNYIELEEPCDDYPQYPNGGPLYILEMGQLSVEAVLAEAEFLQKLLDEAMANGMRDGQDCTELIKNPHFNNEGVWVKDGLAEWPKGTDTYKLAEAYSIKFDVSQTITGLQNGLYELQLSDLYRPANYNGDGYGIFRGFVYLNTDEAPLNHIESDGTDDSAYENDIQINGKYLPNSIEGAAKAFQDGRYRQTLYGLVTDGTLKIGVRNDVRYEGCWALWSDFKLIFRAKNPEALASVLAASLPNAEEKLDSKCGNEELDALQAAINAAKGEPEDGYEALVNLKNAIAAVETCTSTYAQLFVALQSADNCLMENAGNSSAALSKVEQLMNEAYAAYQNGSYNNQTALDMAAAINAAIVDVMMGGGESAEEQDVSSLIVNNDFDPARGDKGEGRIDGWVTSALNGYKEHSASYNKATIDLHQTLNGLKAGHYRLTVHTYYRAGYYDEEWTRKENGEETHLTTLYAETPAKKYETKVMNLYEGAQAEAPNGVKCYTLPNGLLAPDGTTPTVAFFDAGYYLNTLEFDVTEDGTDVTIGLSKKEILPNDYEVVGKWNLYYTPKNEKDVSDLIVNNDFDPARGDKGEGRIDGWVTSALNGYKEHSASYNKATIDLHQTLNGLKAGHYRLTVHTYYRAGYYDEEWTRKENGEETHLTTLYAETPAKKYETKVMNLYEDAQAEAPNGVKCYTLPNGLLAPDGTTPTVAFFDAGYYLNTLEFDVTEDGTDVTIGLSKKEILPNDYEVVGKWNLYYTPAPSAKDVSDLIVNNDFDPARGDKGEGRIDGWVTSALNGYKEHSASYNKATIDLHQTIHGLPAGDYKVTVHTYYRAGYYDEEWTRKENGEETHLTTLYAQTPDNKYETKVMNLYEDAQAEAPNGVKCYTLPNGLLAPDGTTPTVAFFDAGYYLNELKFTVNENGSDVTIGLSKTEILPNDYEVVGKWNLYYYGKGNADAIEEVEAETSSSAAAGIYNLSGVRLNAPQRGVNIIKTADGRVMKIYVK